MSFPDQDEPSGSRRRRGRRGGKDDFEDFWGRDNGGTPGKGRKRGSDPGDISDLADDGPALPSGGRAAMPSGGGAPRRGGSGRQARIPSPAPGAGAGRAADEPRQRPAQRPPLTSRPAASPGPAPRPPLTSRPAPGAERPPVGPSSARRPVGAQAAVPPHRRTGEFDVPGGADVRPSRGRPGAGPGPGRAPDDGRRTPGYDDPRTGASRFDPASRGADRGDRGMPAGRDHQGAAPGARGPVDPGRRTGRPVSAGPIGPQPHGGSPQRGTGRMADPAFRSMADGPVDPDRDAGPRRPAGPGGGRGGPAGVNRPTEAVDMSDLVFTGANDLPGFPDVDESPSFGAGGPRPPWDDEPADDDFGDDVYYDDDYDELDEGELDDLPKRRGCRNALIALAVIVVVALVASWFGWSWVQGKIDPSGTPGEEVLVEIPEGTSTAGIGEVLADAGVITDAGLWNWYTKLNDPGSIQAGSYRMRVNSSFDEAIDDLAKNPLPPNSSLVTIPEGLTQAQIAARLADPEDGVAGFTVEGVNAALNDPASRSPVIPANQPLLEGTLFPETYTVEEGDTEAVVIRRMVDQYESVATELDLTGRAEALGRTPYDVLIVASMIERESGTDADAPKVARVIYNRLANGEPLGIDATSCYEKDQIPCQLTEAELNDNSAYDTRSQTGLPPTPIASPGRAAIEAALAPADGPWLWYVLDAEKNDGSSYFTDDYDDFLAAKARCQEAGLC